MRDVVTKLRRHSLARPKPRISPEVWYWPRYRIYLQAILFMTFTAKYPQIQKTLHSLPLTHWGRVTHMCVDNLVINDSDNGLSPGRCQTVIWINAGILLIGPLGTNYSGILIEVHTFSFEKMHLNMLSGKWLPFCLGLNVLRARYGVSFVSS